MTCKACKCAFNTAAECEFCDCCHTTQRVEYVRGSKLGVKISDDEMENIRTERHETLPK